MKRIDPKKNGNTVPPTSGTHVLRAGRIFVFPTPFGFLYAALMVAMLIGSINYANNLGYLVTFLLVALGIVAIFHTYSNLRGLALSAGKVSPVFAGQKACFEILLSNHQPATRIGLQVVSGENISPLVDLEKESTEPVNLWLPAPRRGQLSLGRLEVRTRYPLGLLRAWSYLSLGMNCLVYPRPGPPESLPDKSSMAAHPRSTPETGSDDFAGLRHYRPGDPLRHVDWKAVARERGMHVKQYQSLRGDVLWLDWKDLPEAGVEQRLGILCRWVLSASETDMTFGLKLPGREIAPARGVAHKEQCLSALARF